MAQRDDIQNGSQRYDLESHEDADHALKKIRTAGSVSISPELFEKMYLSPQNRVSGDIRRTFGNPTPIAIGGFLLALCPPTNDLLGWQHAGVLDYASVANYWFFGGLLMEIGGVLECYLGNTFSCVVFTLFGAFWLSFAGTLTPSFDAFIAYDPEKPDSAVLDPIFLDSFAFFPVYMGVLCLIFLIASHRVFAEAFDRVRTNLIFFIIFLLLVPTFGCLAGSFRQLAAGKAALAKELQHVGAGLAFAVCLLGWYLFLVQILAAVDFPINLPVIDLSTHVKGASDKRRDEESNAENQGEKSIGQRLKFWKK